MAVAAAERGSRAPQLILAVSMFVTGGCGLVAQYILSTVSTYILGNSIEQFSVIIALTLLMMGLAGMVQRTLSDKNLVEKFVATEIAIGLLCGFTPLAMYAAYANLSEHFALVQFALILSIGFLIGLEIPLAIRINERFAPSLKANIANIWALDYVGSFVGAVVWAFLLIRALPLTEISFLVGFLNLGVGALTLLYFWKHGHAGLGKWMGVAWIACAALMAFGMANNRVWSLGLEQRLYDDPIVFSQTSKYQRIVVTERPNDLRLFLNGNLQFSSVDEAIYHEHLVHPAMTLAPYRRRVLILGGGDGMALREVLKYKDVESVTLVDLDPAMIELGKNDPRIRKLNGNAFADARVTAQVSPGVQPSPERRDVVLEEEPERPGQRPPTVHVATVNVFTVDAFRFVGESSERFDVILVDLPDPSAIELAKLYSREFYTFLRKRLSADGVMTVQATSPFHAKEAFLCILRTLRSAGFSVEPYHDNVPSFGSWGWALCTNRPVEPARWDALKFDVPRRYLTEEVAQRSRAFGADWLKTEKTEVSTLLRPIVLDEYIRSGWQVD